MGNSLKENSVKISVCVAIHGVEKYLDKCLKSLQNQTNFNDYEVLLLLDSPLEGDVRVAQKYVDSDKRFKIFNLDFKDQGLVRNYGCKVAQGEYVYFVDGDDYLEPNCLANFFEVIKKENPDIAISNYYLEKNGKKIKAFIHIKDNWHYKTNYKRAKAVASDIKIRGYVWNKIYRRDFLLSNNLYSVPARYFIEDVNFNFLTFLKARKIVTSEKYNYVYVFRKNSSLHFDPFVFIKKYLYSLALMRYYSLENDIKKTTNLNYFNKKFMLIVHGLQNYKFLKMNIFNYFVYINKEINKIRKCQLSEYLKDQVFQDAYFSLLSGKTICED